MNKAFTENGWEDYVYWQTEDKKTLKKINSLIDDICRNGNEGVGKPEPLVGNLYGYWSRRINDKDRIIYKFDENEFTSPVKITKIYAITCN
ncbi:MAG TPA: Txe/YoeB family addiction module toxin [Anaerovoracaceae bacterium]|nr:Txe/YoeB family addiction module toxin [Anaerovoracaceae bacterium]